MAEAGDKQAEYEALVGEGADGKKAWQAAGELKDRAAIIDRRRPLLQAKISAASERLRETRQGLMHRLRDSIYLDATARQRQHLRDLNDTAGRLLVEAEAEKQLAEAVTKEMERYRR